MSVETIECPKCKHAKHLREHCEVKCFWMVCDGCQTTIDIKSGRFHTPKNK